MIILSVFFFCLNVLTAVSSNTFEENNISSLILLRGVFNRITPGSTVFNISIYGQKYIEDSLLQFDIITAKMQLTKDVNTAIKELHDLGIDYQPETNYVDVVMSIYTSYQNSPEAPAFNVVAEPRALAFNSTLMGTT